MLRRVREFWQGLAPKHKQKFMRRKSSFRFSKHKLRVHLVSSRKCNNMRGSRRIDSYQVAMNVNESASDKIAKGCDKNPVPLTCSLSGHCSTSTTDFSYYSEEAVFASTEKFTDEREININGSNKAGLLKKVVENSTKCQSAVSCSSLDDDIPVSSKTESRHKYVKKKACQMKVENLRFDFCFKIYFCAMRWSYNLTLYVNSQVNCLTRM